MGKKDSIPYVQVARTLSQQLHGATSSISSTITSPSVTLPGGCHVFFLSTDGRSSTSLAFIHVSPRLYIREKDRSCSQKGNAGYAGVQISLLHHHRESYRAANDEHHFLAPSSRRGRLSGLQARAARRRPRGGDARCARRRICRSSACTNDSNRCNNGLAPVGECTCVHDGAGLGTLSLTA